jgi:hypothetical protein
MKKETDKLNMEENTKTMQLIKDLSQENARLQDKREKVGLYERFGAGIVTGINFAYVIKG